MRPFHKHFLNFSLILSFLIPVFASGEIIDPKALQLGNNKWSESPKVGYLYPCEPDKYYTITNTGSSKNGPWLGTSTWDTTKKISVSGEVFWPEAKLTISTTTTTRTITTNDLPVGNPSGVFPVSKNDPAYEYDPNPNAIKAQNFSFTVPLNPEVNEAPSCVELPIAVGLDGVVFFSALDSHGRDEPAYEVQDNCGGMSAPDGIYHRYRSSSCLPHADEKNALVGYALDGFGIYTPYTEDGKELTTADLDVCHGITSEIIWNGKKVNMYHYVLTRDFPYSISCFKGTPQSIPIPPPPIAYRLYALIGAAIIVPLGIIIFLIKKRKKKVIKEN